MAEKQTKKSNTCLCYHGCFESYFNNFMKDIVRRICKKYMCIRSKLCVLWPLFANVCQFANLF